MTFKTTIKKNVGSVINSMIFSPAFRNILIPVLVLNVWEMLDTLKLKGCFLVSQEIVLVPDNV